jgi:hypothetical protein
MFTASKPAADDAPLPPDAVQRAVEAYASQGGRRVIAGLQPTKVSLAFLRLDFP